MYTEPIAEGSSAFTEEKRGRNYVIALRYSIKGGHLMRQVAFSILDIKVFCGCIPPYTRGVLIKRQTRTLYGRRNLIDAEDYKR